MGGLSRASIVKDRSPKKPYTVRFRDSFGKQHEKSFITRKEASACVTDQERAKRYGNDANLIAAMQSFNEHTAAIGAFTGYLEQATGSVRLGQGCRRGPHQDRTREP